MCTAITSRTLLGLLLSLSLATPALARGDYALGGGLYAHDTRTHRAPHRHRGGQVAAGILGGLIIGALIASSHKSERERPLVVQQPIYVPTPPVIAAPIIYAAPVQYVPIAQPAYVPIYSAEQCYERTVTEKTVSGRIVTYTELLC